MARAHALTLEASIQWFHIYKQGIYLHHKMCMQSADTMSNNMGQCPAIPLWVKITYGLVVVIVSHNTHNRTLLVPSGCFTDLKLDKTFAHQYPRNG